MSRVKKEDIISSIYYDRSGYGSRAQTLKDSREKDKSITKEDVEEFFRKNVDKKWAINRKCFTVMKKGVCIVKPL